MKTEKFHPTLSMPEDKKLNVDQLDFLFSAAKIAMKEHKGLRYGQSIFNAGCNLHPIVFEAVRGSLLNPFYLNSLIPYMVEEICNEEAIQFYYKSLHIN